MGRGAALGRSSLITRVVARNISVVAVGLGVTAVLSGCQTTMLSDDRIASSTAGVLGIPPSDVTISERRTDGPTNTYYVATTKDKKTYACVINGGGLLAAGLVNPPTCNPRPASSAGRP